MTIIKISFIILLAINITVAQQFWNQFQPQDIPNYLSAILNLPAYFEGQPGDPNYVAPSPNYDETQDHRNYFENAELWDVLNYNPSRLRSYSIAGIPSVGPSVRNYKINDSFEAGIPPVGPVDDYGSSRRNYRNNILGYFLPRQHIVSQNNFKVVF